MLADLSVIRLMAPIPHKCIGLTNLGKAVCLFACLLAFPSSGSALILTKTQDIDFGQVIGGSNYTGTVSVDIYGSRWYTGSLHPIGGSYSVARFVINGKPSAAYTLTLPRSFTMTSGAYPMTVSGLTASIPLTGTLPISGVLPFMVGGTLTVGPGQSNKVYSGSMDVTVNTK